MAQPDFSLLISRENTTNIEYDHNLKNSKKGSTFEK